MGESGRMRCEQPRRRGDEKLGIISMWRENLCPLEMWSSFVMHRK